MAGNRRKNGRTAYIERIAVVPAVTAAAAAAAVALAGEAANVQPTAGGTVPHSGYYSQPFPEQCTH